MRADILAAVLWKRRTLRARERWPRERLDAFRERRLRALVEHAFAKSTYWRKALGRSDVPLADIPVLTKATMMSRFDELCTAPSVKLDELARFVEHGDGLFHDRFWVAATSGSSGRRAIVPASFQEWTDTIASYARANEWSGVQARVTQKTKMAVVSSTTRTHQSALVGASVEAPFLVTERFDAGAPLASIVERLNTFRPEILIAYASMLRILADEQSAGRLHIAPRAVNAASEPLTDETRAHTRSAWSIEPFDVYAATETAGIACECEARRGLHLFEDLVITEVVDDDYRAVVPGETGSRLLVTVLSSRTIPLLRYELTDRIRTVAVDEPCACGRTFRKIAGVEGRTDDVLQMPTPGDTRVAVHPVVFHRVLEAAPVHGWQVRQHGGDLELLLARPDAGVDPTSFSVTLENAVAATGALRPRVTVRVVDEIPAGAAGKRPRVVGEKIAETQHAREAAHG